MKSAICALLALLLGACSQPPAAPNKAQEQQPASSVKIIQFYPNPPAVGKGEKTLLCYGVEHASAVRLSPPVEKVWPSPSRCFDVAPAVTTTYTLTAEDSQGHSVSRTAEVVVGAGRAKIIEVNVSALEVTRGTPVRICYTARNGVSVDAGPGRFVTGRNPDKGCISEIPQATTTYHVTITGRNGDRDTEQVTVKVR
jgi:type IV pilus biogenesis protein CpaD/CtpE